MKRSVALLGTVTLVGATLLNPPAVSAASTSTADAVRAWNDITISTVLTGKIPVPEQPLYLTYVHRAVYDAVRATTGSAGNASPTAAAVAAAHDVLVADFPDQQDALDTDYTTSIAALPDSQARAAGLSAGSTAAQAVLVDRADDGRNGTPLPLPAPEPGVWIPTPPNTVGTSSWLGGVRPFALKSASQFRSPPPPSLTSALWARDYNETRIYGSATSTVRTAEQTEVARFWADPPYVQNQAGMRAFTIRHGLNGLATARLFYYADTAAADALIACWDTKFHYNFWRPFSAIPSGDTDGNPATPADPTWVPLLATPNFPEYASAHACATTALFTVVAALTAHGSKRLDIDLASVNTGTTRHYSSVDQLVAEVADARVWGGLHYRFSTVAGKRIGAAVARVVLRMAARQG